MQRRQREPQLDREHVFVVAERRGGRAFGGGRRARALERARELGLGLQQQIDARISSQHRVLEPAVGHFTRVRFAFCERRVGGRHWQTFDTSIGSRI